ncbi:uncharacterized protein LOC117648156 [Thrips palmi]|uniref:Uncharacterized protein LOC117648156 n=1 Tax=Thrips palmi TaxID=161013 RepID=A0A6P8Z7I8_THRPL|nr:uncharacterized protein LOC117648156 [Thrips palmi]
MVKPEYPNQGFNQPASFSHSGADSGEADIRYEQHREEAGYTPNNSLTYSNDDNVFLSSGSHALTFQSYNRSLSCPVPNTVPRERISSLPNPEENVPLEPSTRRRGSAPVSYNSCGVANSSRAEVSDALPPQLLDIAAKGQELFWFVFNEVVKADGVTASGSPSVLTILPHRMEVLNERGRCGGRTLQQIAESFFHSPQRHSVWNHASSIDIQSLDYNSFSLILLGLFQEGGITQTRVLVLIFFCVDIAHRALRENLMRDFQKLVEWTSRFITEQLSAWVLQHGGWAAVLQESVDQAYRVAVVGLCLLTALAVSFWLVRNR